MPNNDWKKRLGVVYSTNPDYSFKADNAAPDSSSAALSPSEQRLVVAIDRKGRAGKQVTLVKNFEGPDESLKELAKMLKTKCGTGGAVKDGEILIQGDCRDKIVSLLISEGYKAKRGN